MKLEKDDIDYVIKMLSGRRLQMETMWRTRGNKVRDHIARIDRLIAWLRDKQRNP